MVSLSVYQNLLTIQKGYSLSVYCFSLTDDAMELLFVSEDLWEVLVSHMCNETLIPDIRAASILAISNLARTG